MAQLRDDKLLRKIAAQIKLMRKNAGLSIQEVYDDTDIHIGRIESTKTNISISTLAKLCTYFKVSLSDFFKQVNP